MGELVWVVVISLLLVGGLIWFAFFPIKLSWFVRKNEREISNRPYRRSRVVAPVDFLDEDDIYDDPEL